MKNTTACKFNEKDFIALDTICEKLNALNADKNLTENFNDIFAFMFNNADEKFNKKQEKSLREWNKRG